MQTMYLSETTISYVFRNWKNNTEKKSLTNISVCSEDP